jgi:molecular chaperone GrpE
MTGHEHSHASHGKPQGGPEPKSGGAAPQPEPAAAEAPGPAAGDLHGPLEAKTREAADLLDQLKRVAAEYSNYQKRVERHREEHAGQAVRGLVLDLLPAIDNLDRALAAARQASQHEALLEGMALVHGQLLAALAKHGVTPIDAAAGAVFDPEHHEAVACIPSDAPPAGRVLEQLQRGYQLRGRTLRPAHVAVSGGPAGPAEDAASETHEPQP